LRKKLHNYVEIKESTGTVAHIAGEIRGVWGHEYCIITSDDMEVRDSSGTKSKHYLIWSYIRVQRPFTCKIAFENIKEKTTKRMPHYASQIVKEFARRQGINTFLLDPRSDTLHSRPKWYKLIRQEISSPSLPTIEEVLKEQDQMISDGQLNVGEPCAPFTINRIHITAAGTLHEQITVERRKISLLDM